MTQKSFDPDKKHVFVLAGNDPEYSKVIDSKLAELTREIEQIVDWAEAFQKFNQQTEGRWGHISDGPLESASRAAIFSAFTEIWGNPDNLSPWHPPQYVIDDGLTVSQSIPSGAIVIS